MKGNKSIQKNNKDRSLPRSRRELKAFRLKLRPLAGDFFDDDVVRE